MTKKVGLGLWALAFVLAMGLSSLIPPMQSPDETSHNVDDAKTQQYSAWQAFDSGLTNDGGGGDMHSIGFQKKKQPGDPGCFLAKDRTSVRANITSLS